ncbi:uncharacterized protein G2W53_008941 [Senna tora]|uniref:Uncharacterized protein n=1 Tax=Senna tora TaxID=362788 RepID=A0A834WX97_9FABA|nr:uncharacterized protein G2W53_008941 [Senna tora]
MEIASSEQHAPFHEPKPIAGRGGRESPASEQHAPLQ